MARPLYMGPLAPGVAMSPLRPTSARNFPRADAAGAYRQSGVLTPQQLFGASLKRCFDFRSATMTGATWTDQTGNADATQGVGANQPSAGATIGGRATLSGDGVDDTMVAGAVPWTTTSGWTVYVVGRTGTLAAGTADSGDCVWSESGGYAMAGLTTTCDAARFDSAYRNTSPTRALANATVFCRRTSEDGGTSGTLRDRISGFAESTVAYSAALGSAAGNLNLFKNYTAGTEAQVELAAVYVVNRVATPAENAAVDAWILATFGVSGIS